MHTKNRKHHKWVFGFTLVELIVVITILVILGTIAFVSLGGFSGSARDSSRVSDLSLIGKGLDIHYTKLWSFPVPTSSTGITFGSSSSIVWYQWTIGEWVIRSLGWAWARISTKPVDPLSKEEYRYSLPTGVNEYLLAADYEGDSVALLQNWELRAQNWGLEIKDGEDFVIASRADARRSNPGEHNRASDLTKEEDVTWIASLRSQRQENPLATWNFPLATPVSAATGSPTISYLKGTYNGVATRVLSGSTINIIALPSIFLSSGSTGTIVDASSRNFLLQGKSLSGVSFAPKVVYSSGALPSNDTERLLFSSGIVAAYSGTALASNSDIRSFIDNVNSTGSLSAVGGNFVRNKFGGNGPTVVVASSTASSSASISSSLMFNGSNQRLVRTPGTGSSPRNKYTISTWVKRGGTDTPIASAGTANLDYFWFDGSGQFYWQIANNAGVRRTSAMYRDYAAWYHVVLVYDSTNPIPADTMKVYINGDRVTAFATMTNPSWTESHWNNNVLHAIWADTYQWTFWYGHFGGYLADFQNIDGLALDASYFWVTDANGQWVPKQYTGSYGTNGFRLDFSSWALTSGSNSGLGRDVSGNTNYWNTTNISVAGNQMIDTPTNNFATWNPLASSNPTTFINGNLSWLATSSLAPSTSGTLPLVGSGKSYWETNIDTFGGANGIGFGVYEPSTWKQWYMFAWDGTYGGKRYSSDGGWNLTAYSVAPAQGNTVSVLYDDTTGNLSFWLDGSDKGVAFTGLQGKILLPWLITNNVNGYKTTTNFGQGWQSMLVYSTGAGGYFKYAPPTGYKALSVANLPTPTWAAANPKQYFDVLTWTGDGNATRSLTGLLFSPDLIWSKTRNQAYDHRIVDSLRGASTYLNSGDTGTWRSLSGRPISIDPFGFTVGFTSWFLGGANVLNDTHAAWNWRKWNGTTGPWFDVVATTTAGGSSIFNHSLGKLPDFVIIRPTDVTSNWTVYHKNIGPDVFMRLNTSDQSAPSAGAFPTISATQFSSTVSHQSNGNNMIAYLWSEVPGFSKFGSYMGNGNTNGPFVYTGFKPRYIMIKNTTTSGVGWMTYDTARTVFNGWTDEYIIPNATNTNTGTTTIDVLSNGFKIRIDSWTALNANGANLIYAAFAEAPFKYATAR